MIEFDKSDSNFQKTLTSTNDNEHDDMPLQNHHMEKTTNSGLCRGYKTLQKRLGSPRIYPPNILKLKEVEQNCKVYEE